MGPHLAQASKRGRATVQNAVWGRRGASVVQCAHRRCVDVSYYVCFTRTRMHDEWAHKWPRPRSEVATQFRTLFGAGEVLLLRSVHIADVLMCRTMCTLKGRGCMMNGPTNGPGLKARSRCSSERCLGPGSEHRRCVDVSHCVCFKRDEDAS